MDKYVNNVCQYSHDYDKIEQWRNLENIPQTSKGKMERCRQLTGWTWKY